MGIRVPTSGGNGPTRWPQLRPSATPLLPLCLGQAAATPQCACSRQSPRNGLARRRSRPPRWEPAGRSLPGTPTAAAAAPDGALASAPSDGQAGETPVASVRLNVRPAPPRINMSGFKSVPASSGAPAHGRAQWHGDNHANSSAARDFAADARIPRSSRADHKNSRKKSS